MDTKPAESHKRKLIDILNDLISIRKTLTNDEEILVINRQIRNVKIAIEFVGPNQLFEVSMFIDKAGDFIGFDSVTGHPVYKSDSNCKCEMSYPPPNPPDTVMTTSEYRSITNMISLLDQETASSLGLKYLEGYAFTDPMEIIEISQYISKHFIVDGKVKITIKAVHGLLLEKYILKMIIEFVIRSLAKNNRK